MLNKILMGAKPLVFGHRGFSEVAPENTIASFKLCRELKVPAVELDVHLCASGEVVVAHDFVLKRTTGEEGTIEEWPLKDLKRLDFGLFKGQEFRGERIPLLDELFEEFGDCFLYDIELKCDKTANKELARKTWEIVCRHKLQNSVMASSFSPLSLREFNRISGRSVPTADIFAEDDTLPRILRRGFGRHVSRSSYLKPDHHQVDEAYMRKFKERLGYPIITWTVNDKKTALSLIALGVDGLIGNNPKILMEAVEESKAALR